MRAWAIVPTAVSERDAVIDLLEAATPRDLLADKGFSGRAFEAELAACGSAVLVPPDKRQPAMLAILLKSSPSGATGSRRPSARSPTGWNSPATAPWPPLGLLTRTAATIAAHTLQLTCLTQA